MCRSFFPRICSIIPLVLTLIFLCPSCARGTVPARSETFRSGVAENAGAVSTGATGSASGTDQAVSPQKAIRRNGDITIVLVPKSLDNSIFLDAKEESERVGRELGIRVEWQGPMHADANGQVNIVESLIRRGVNGIVVNCLDADKMKPVIDKALAAGIKVATFDSDSPDSGRLFYCGTDNAAAGAACCNAMIRVLQEKNRLGGKVRLLVMTADEGSYNLNERLRSFQDTAKSKGVDLEVVDTLYCRNDVNLAGEMLEIYMRTGKEFDVFFSTGGWPLMGSYEALPRFQRWCRSGGTSIVMDTYYSILYAAKNGLADALVGQDFHKMGELSIRALYRAIKGEAVPHTFIDTGLELGTKDNFGKLLQGKEQWETP
jgi:ribose transport system substrate-binding protein